MAGAEAFENEAVRLLKTLANEIAVTEFSDDKLFATTLKVNLKTGRAGEPRMPRMREQTTCALRSDFARSRHPLRGCPPAQTSTPAQPSFPTSHNNKFYLICHRLYAHHRSLYLYVKRCKLLCGSIPHQLVLAYHTS